MGALETHLLDAPGVEVKDEGQVGLPYVLASLGQLDKLGSLGKEGTSVEKMLPTYWPTYRQVWGVFS